jgi:hypothetical protein
LGVEEFESLEVIKLKILGILIKSCQSFNPENPDSDKQNAPT